MNKVIFLMLLLVLTISCSNPNRLQAAAGLQKAGYNEMTAGNWQKSKQHFKKALFYANHHSGRKRFRAVLWYEYGRVSGVVCDWSEAEKGLAESYRLDSESGGPAYMSLVELGRMHFKRKQYSKTVDYYTKVKPEFDKLQVDTRDPLGYADYLEEFAIALENTNDTSVAKKYRSRANQIREAFPGRKAYTDITPYGTQCAK